jgi:hypothetical protein
MADNDIPVIQLTNSTKAPTDDLPRISHNTFMRTNRIEPLSLKSARLTDEHRVSERTSGTQHLSNVRRKSGDNQLPVGSVLSTELPESLIDNTSQDQTYFSNV